MGSGWDCGCGWVGLPFFLAGFIYICLPAGLLLACLLLPFTLRSAAHLALGPSRRRRYTLHTPPAPTLNLHLPYLSLQRVLQLLRLVGKVSRWVGRQTSPSGHCSSSCCRCNSLQTCKGSCSFGTDMQNVLPASPSSAPPWALPVPSPRRVLCGPSYITSMRGPAICRPAPSRLPALSHSHWTSVAPHSALQTPSYPGCSIYIPHVAVVLASRPIHAY